MTWLVNSAGFRFKRTAVHASVVLLLSACAAPQGDDNFFKRNFANDDPCSNNARNMGIVGGALVGALVGNAVGSGKADSTWIGTAIGGALGALIGADMDRKRCELAKIAKQYDLSITVTRVDVKNDTLVEPEPSQAASPPGSAAAGSANPAEDEGTSAQVIGQAVSVQDRDGPASHFETGSDVLTPKAREYFDAIASQYGPAAAFGSEKDPRRRRDIEHQLSLRRILLVGHTDDTGSSATNAQLAERRAKTVAIYLRQKGVPEAQIYYQGAGESFPVADNRTEVGRAQNRRVEIVELVNAQALDKYLQLRKPQYAYYRTQAPIQEAAHSPSPKTVVTRPKASVLPSKAPVPASPGAEAVIALGGQPYSPAAARIETGALTQEKGLRLMSSAYADDGVLLNDCTHDRPRSVGSVKSFTDAKPYRTSEHWPQLYGKTWASMVNGHLVLVNRLAVLRQGGQPANLPELKIYTQYRPNSSKRPDVTQEPEVNSYIVEKGLLYRMFTKGGAGLRCVDLLFDGAGGNTAKDGKIIYSDGAQRFVADFKPQTQ